MNNHSHSFVFDPILSWSDVQQPWTFPKIKDSLASSGTLMEPTDGAGKNNFGDGGKEHSGLVDLMLWSDYSGLDIREWPKRYNGPGTLSPEHFCFLRSTLIRNLTMDWISLWMTYHARGNYVMNLCYSIFSLWLISLSKLSPVILLNTFQKTDWMP